MTDAPEPEFPQEKIEHCAESLSNAWRDSHELERNYSTLTAAGKLIWAKRTAAVLRAAKEWDAREGGRDRMREALQAALPIVLAATNCTGDDPDPVHPIYVQMRAAITQSTAKEEGE
jgi:hypothetical protein